MIVKVPEVKLLAADAGGEMLLTRLSDDISFVAPSFQVTVESDTVISNGRGVDHEQVSGGGSDLGINVLNCNPSQFRTPKHLAPHIDTRKLLIPSPSLLKPLSPWSPVGHKYNDENEKAKYFAHIPIMKFLDPNKQNKEETGQQPEESAGNFIIFTLQKL